MGKKGFTLVELIATIFILSIVFGIASYSIVSVVNNSKKKSEILFVEKIDKAISQYVSLDGGKLVKDKTAAAKTYNFEKCKNAYCSEKKVAQAVELLANGTENIRLSVILDLFEDEKLINPVNKLNCLDGLDPVIRIFKDSDYVYYYYVNIGGDNTSCEINSENGIINTLPDELKSEVGL